MEVRRVIIGADSIFEVELPLSHDATSAAENEATTVAHKPLGLEKKLIPEMDLACKNTPRNQFSSFYDKYHTNYDYGRFSILYIT